LIAAGAGYGDAAALDILGKAGGAAMNIGVGTQINIGPRLQAFKDALKQPNVLRIVAAHGAPSLIFTFNATAPESGACNRELATAAEIPADVIELIAVELSNFAAYLEGIEGFKGTWWAYPMHYESSLDFFNIEGIAVMRDDYIGFIQDLPKVSAEMRVACFGGLVRWIVGEAIRLDRFVPLPEHGKAEQEGIALDPDYILNVSERPNAG
jgi:hypothetical protein